ncbi:sulfur carrier protein ThiS [Corynebacterium accolens]|jgi:thiamine biosynthesis protein thiS|uniref:Thiamine biosynthesis protein n=1 Tax=Corynebacterium segmentosum TaxID=43990 RepID=A0ABY6TEZ9_9CORY|nr:MULTISPECIES: sulfur carrier protein ThiS [Corynebacterium]MDK4275135.1 sulfur carrier protein ThiS [Corynebacterium accolens]MDK4294490.1 sulfur carrier protein ThiS [Corynebacterium accolens]VEH72839.1 thiamine biosynthesis protein [Corynebacterium segmentosum]
MDYTLNGEPRHSDGPITVGAIVEAETGEASPKGAAVAINGDVIPASNWSHEVTDGDQLDILIAVQGG